MPRAQAAVEGIVAAAEALGLKSPHREGIKALNPGGAGQSPRSLPTKATILWKRTSLFLIGITLMLAGLAFRFYAMSVLGRFFTYDVAVHPGQTVVEVGPYRHIRHPSYTGALITLVGLGLALGNWAGLLALLACMGTAYAYRISVEEAALVAALGEPYKEYMRRTRRLVPFLY